MIERITTEYPDFDDLKYTVNQLVDAVNELKESQHIYKKSSITRAKNVQSDVKTRPVTVSELAYLQKENSDLKDELERTREALDYAIGVIQTVAKMSDKLSKEYGETLVEQLDNIQAYCWQEGYVLTHKEDLERAITALEQKD